MEQFPINIDMYMAIVSFFLPGLIAVVNRCSWSSARKYWASFGIVCVAAAGHLIFSGQADWTDIPGTVLKVLFLSIGSYLVFWRPSGISDRIEKGINPGKECK